MIVNTDGDNDEDMRSLRQDLTFNHAETEETQTTDDTFVQVFELRTSGLLQDATVKKFPVSVLVLISSAGIRAALGRFQVIFMFVKK